jgi:hypothetical protein
MAVKGIKERFWPMREGGPYGPESQIFKCTGCGAETAPEAGWNGEPSRHNCRPGCPCQAGDWKIGAAGGDFRRNFDRIFPNAPGAGL